MSIRPLARWLLVPMMATSLQGQARRDTTAAGNEGSLKSPTTAGILGGAGAFVGVPGLGSFYAGNSGHGIRHLAIGLVSGGVAAGGVAACWHMDCSDATGMLIIGGLAAYAANAAWSIFVGVADAHAYNRRPELGGTFSPGGVTIPLVRLEF
jgi:hypothetical protein